MRFDYKANSKFQPTFDPDRCAASVSEPGRGVSIYQCQRKHRPDERYCYQHSDEALAKQKVRQEANYRAYCSQTEREQTALYLGRAAYDLGFRETAALRLKLEE